MNSMGRKVCVNIITKNAVMRFTYRFSALFFEACTTHHTLLTIILGMYVQHMFNPSKKCTIPINFKGYKAM